MCRIRSYGTMTVAGRFYKGVMVPKQLSRSWLGRRWLWRLGMVGLQSTL